MPAATLDVLRECAPHSVSLMRAAALAVPPLQACAHEPRVRVVMRPDRFESFEAAAGFLALLAQQQQQPQQVCEVVSGDAGGDLPLELAQFALIVERVAVCGMAFSCGEDSQEDDATSLRPVPLRVFRWLVRAADYLDQRVVAARLQGPAAPYICEAAARATPRVACVRLWVDPEHAHVPWRALRRFVTRSSSDLVLCGAWVDLDIAYKIQDVLEREFRSVGGVRRRVPKLVLENLEGFVACGTMRIPATDAFALAALRSVERLALAVDALNAHALF